MVYAWKAGRNTWWFVATLLVLGLFVVLNITLYASDYFTGDGINDAVLYTLTNSLTGAGVSKYILPGIGIAAALVLVFGLLGWVLRRRRHHPYHLGYSLLALVLALGSVDASPAFHQITELVKSQSRDGDPDFAAYYKEPSKTIARPKLNLVYIYGESLERTYFDNDAFQTRSNPIPWINTWLVSDNVQVAPQEVEVSSYLVGQIDAEVNTDDLSDFQL
jgi:phosphoglycerol transferase